MDLYVLIMDWDSTSCSKILGEVEYPYAFWLAISALVAMFLGIVLDRRFTGVLIAVCLGGMSLWRIRTQSRSSCGLQLIGSGL